MSGTRLHFAVLLVLGSTGCSGSGDASFFLYPGGGVGVDIAFKQSDVCNLDCSTEEAQLSPVMSIVLQRYVDGGVSGGELVPGTYVSGPSGPMDTGLFVTLWKSGGACDNTNICPCDVVGTVTITQVPASSADRLQGTYQIDGGLQDEVGVARARASGAFSAHTCR